MTRCDSLLTRQRLLSQKILICWFGTVWLACVTPSHVSEEAQSGIEFRVYTSVTRRMYEKAVADVRETNDSAAGDIIITSVSLSTGIAQFNYAASHMPVRCA